MTRSNGSLREYYEILRDTIVETGRQLPRSATQQVCILILGDELSLSPEEAFRRWNDNGMSKTFAALYKPNRNPYDLYNEVKKGNDSHAEAKFI